MSGDSPHVRVAALAALREQFVTELGLPKPDVGGWEIVPGRRVSLAVYIHEGDLGFKPGGAGVNGGETLMCVLTLRGGSVPLAEAKVADLQDAVALIINRFEAPGIAGAKAENWSFDIAGDNSFDNILTVKGKIWFQTRGGKDAAKISVGRAAAVLLDYVRQENP